MFYNDLNLVSNWKPWRLLLTGSDEDTDLADLKPATFPTAPNEKILPTKIRPDEALVIRCFGTDTSNDTAEFRFTGWMKNHPKFGRGKGFELCDGQMLLGAESLAAAPIDGANWGAGPWLEVDTYTLTQNACQAAALGVADNQSILVLPTLGFMDILCEISGKDGSTGVEAVGIGVMYRQIPAATAYAMIESLIGVV